MDSQFITLQIRLPNVLFLAATFYISVTGTENEAGPIRQAPDLWMSTTSATGSTSHSLIPHAADISLPVQRQAGDKNTLPSKRTPTKGMTDRSLGRVAREGERPSLNMTANQTNTNNPQTKSAIESQIFKNIQIPKEAQMLHVPREIKNRKETTSHTLIRTTKPTGNTADSQHTAVSGMMSNLSRFMTYRSKTTRSLARTSDADSSTQSQTTATGEVSASGMVTDGNSSHLQSRTILQSMQGEAGDTPWTQRHTTETTSETAINWKSQDDQWSVPRSGLVNQVKAEGTPTSALEMSNAAGTLVTSAVSSKENIIALPAQEADLITPESQPTHYMAVLHVRFQVRPADTGEDSHIAVLLEQLCLLLLAQFTLEDVELRWTPEEKVYFVIHPEDNSTDQFIHLGHVKNKCKMSDVSNQTALTTTIETL